MPSPSAYRPPDTVVMSDDPAQIREAARQVQALAGQARREAHRVTTQSGVRWAGLAADAYRDRLHDRSRDFAGRAGDLEDLARALFAHARHVEDHEAVLSATVHGAEAIPGPLRGLAVLAEKTGLVS